MSLIQQTSRLKNYTQPKYELAFIKVPHHILAGSYGDANQAGGSFNNDNTNNYENDLL